MATNNSAPTDAPPSYAMATGSSTASKSNKSNHLEVPGTRNGIPAAHRRSMEDEHRPLPTGWVRQFDTNEQHQFFVDTKASPPRSIWHHPYDDDEYLSTLTSEERERIQEEERERLSHSDYTDDEQPSDKKGSTKPISSQNTGSSFPEDLPPRASSSTQPHKKLGFAEKLKQKATGMTKEERDQARINAEKQEQEYYIAHQKFRQCVQQAQVTGQPQWFARDPQGRDVYVEPPQYGYGGYQSGATGYNPYNSGPYSNPNARFIRPQAPYGRPYGYGPGRGGGYGLPLATGALGGLFLGGLLF